MHTLCIEGAIMSHATHLQMFIRKEIVHMFLLGKQNELSFLNYIYTLKCFHRLVIYDENGPFVDFLFKLLYSHFYAHSIGWFV